MCFEIEKLFREILKFEKVQCDVSVIFETKIRKRSKEIPELIHYSTAKITSIFVTIYLSLDFKNAQSILAYPVQGSVIIK